MKKLLLVLLLSAASAFAQQSATGNITITAAPALSVKSSTVSCNVSQPCTGSLQATGGVAPYTWKVSSGTLPSGFTFNSDGSFTWTPSAPVTGTVVQVTVTDSSGHSVSLNWTPGKGGTAVSEFDIYRNTNTCSPMTAIGSVTSSKTSYTDSNVSAGQKLCYGVTAKSSTGVESAMSNTAMTQVPTP